MGDSVQILIEYYTDSTQCRVQGSSEPFSGSTISYRSCPSLKRIDVLVLWTREGVLDNTSGNQLVEEVIQNTAESAILFGTIAIRNSGIIRENKLIA